MSASTLSFVHLSDPHLTSLASVRWRQLTSKRVMGYLSWRFKRRGEHRAEVLDALTRDLQAQSYDHLVVTGDLTHISLPEEFAEARAWLDSMGRPEDVSIVPGNHDAYVDLPAGQGLAQWAPYMESDSDIPLNGAGFPSLRIRGPVAFIGLSSAVPSRPLFATGRVGAEQRARFADLLQWAGGRGLCRVVLIHHPPVPGLERWRKRLTDAGEVSEVIDKHGAELVLHGHCHRPLESRLTYAGRRHVPVIGAPSALSMHPDPERVARYYLYQVSATPEHWKMDVRVQRYDHAQDAFLPAQGFALEVPRANAR